MAVLKRLLVDMVALKEDLGELWGCEILELRFGEVVDEAELVSTDSGAADRLLQLLGERLADIVEVLLGTVSMCVDRS